MFHRMTYSNKRPKTNLQKTLVTNLKVYASDASTCDTLATHEMEPLAKFANRATDWIS